MDRMLRGMTTRQFQEWRAYADLEPFDETRADLRAASIVQTILNIKRGNGKPPIKLKDCVLTFEKAVPAPRTAEQAQAEVRRTMEMLMLLQNPNPPKKAKR